MEKCDMKLRTGSSKVKWRAVINTVMNLRIPLKQGTLKLINGDVEL
jgi:hypothetical protein